jgi:hypothetical protein
MDAVDEQSSEEMTAAAEAQQDVRGGSAASRRLEWKDACNRALEVDSDEVEAERAAASREVLSTLPQAMAADVGSSIASGSVAVAEELDDGPEAWICDVLVPLPASGTATASARPKSKLAPGLHGMAPDFFQPLRPFNPQSALPLLPKLASETLQESAASLLSVSQQPAARRVVLDDLMLQSSVV